MTTDTTLQQQRIPAMAFFDYFFPGDCYHKVIEELNFFDGGGMDTLTFSNKK